MMKEGTAAVGGGHGALEGTVRPHATDCKGCCCDMGVVGAGRGGGPRVPGVTRSASECEKEEWGP